MIGDRLSEFIRQSGLTQREVASRAGLKPAKLNKILKGRVKDPGFADIRKIAAVLNLDMKELMDTEIRAVENALQPVFDLAEKRVRETLLDHAKQLHAAGRPEAAETIERMASQSYADLFCEWDDLVTTGVEKIRDAPMAHYSQSAPPASPTDAGRFQRFEIPPEEFIVGDFDYPQTYRGGETELLGGAAAGAFEEIDVSGEFAEVLNPTLRDVQSGRYGVVRVSGDSMEPRLHDGDLVLLDTNEKTPKPKRIMAVYVRGQGSAFGYVHRVGELTLLTKANPAYPPLLLPDDVIIRGTVKKRLSEDLE
jgi:phage repressor protein C with HTH and peptisase S24 domain/transcriptional regulator with XRE-family HTH domain